MTLGFDEMKCMSYSRQQTMEEQTKFPSMQRDKLVLEGRLDHTESAFSNFEGSFHLKKTYFFSDKLHISCELPKHKKHGIV